MKNPEYFRLFKGGHFVGFKRVITEFLTPGGNTWKLEPVEHDPDETQKLSKPAVGISSMKRERISTER